MVARVSDADPADAQTPGLACREEGVGVDLVGPADEVPLVIVGSRTEHRRPLFEGRLGWSVLELLEPALGLLGDRPLCVPAWHRRIVRPPRPPVKRPRARAPRAAPGRRAARCRSRARRPPIAASRPGA